MQGNNFRIRLIRILIAAVVFVNLLCAVEFIFKPALYISGFELEHPIGEAVVRGFGFLFLMWNIPYLVALWHPIQNRTSLYESILMQFIGLAGESFIYTTIPNSHAMAQTTIIRFITFDFLGLSALLLALVLTRSIQVNPKKPL